MILELSVIIIIITTIVTRTEDEQQQQPRCGACSRRWYGTSTDAATVTTPDVAPVLHRSWQLTALAEGRTASGSWDAGQGVTFRA